MATLLTRTISIERQGPASHPSGFTVTLSCPAGSCSARHVEAGGPAELDEVVRQVADLLGDLLIDLGGLLDNEERRQRDGALVLVDEPEG